MSIADTLTTAAEGYLEKLSEVVKTPDFSITLGGVSLTELADRITVLQYGQVLASGSYDEVRRDPRVIEAYLGEEAHA